MRSLKFLLIFPILLAAIGLEPIFTSSCSRTRLLALTYLAQNFGTDGIDGVSGSKGIDGDPGSDRTVFADGTEIKIDLSGEDGGDGSDGSNGNNAICSFQPFNSNENVFGASGGNGGNGGDGGDGGDGGRLTIYYTNLADLKKIYVNAPGGRGGQPGRGGYAGYGCQCSQPTWTSNVCTGVPGQLGYQCYPQTFTCTSGSNGVNGSDGREGRDGRLGIMRIVNSSEPLQDDRPSAEVSLSELQNKTIPLSLNIWEEKDGATALLASGSLIDDRYGEFVERVEKNFELVWQATQPLTGVGDENLFVSLEENKEITVVSPEDVWLSGTISELEDKTQYIVAAVVRRSEVTKLARADFQGNKSDLNFVVVDRANKSEFLETDFTIKYRTARDGDPFSSDRTYRTRYEGQIPSELVTRNRNRFVLNIGKLPVRERFLRSGVPVEIELVITRSLGERSAQQTINWRGVIK